MELPIEIINHIFSYRQTHPIAKMIKYAAVELNIKKKKYEHCATPFNLESLDVMNRQHKLINKTNKIANLIFILSDINFRYDMIPVDDDFIE